MANSKFSSIVLTLNEVQLVLNLLQTGKASGPNGINNSILKEWALEVSLPLYTLLIYLFNLVLYLNRIKKVMSAQYLRKMTHPCLVIADQSLSLTLRTSCLKD